ncbi:CO/xanthine dehydrogenase Mo-binding subunit [Sedimentibacter acidaminivorans]|uniref:CO/xanthine dehydrogenase Mo-binding subunit n=1 Tax=Sedimentibacter acidaminivorans TaxID=913099 RepID=A0ABS4GDW8_9FIRM|nr:molybdopterin cofactor-binding domain-containing protein [Sedimentibacter acidaminivorans]MBP1925889.1 CO/xanthine dehydrogenase Mo-binding subunit [Sedimentibacter acidaminivorans]
MGNFNIIGKSVEKKDSLSKVLGTAQFAADIEFENMLYGAVKRSEVPSAILKNVDVSKAKALPGVVSVLTYKDITGGNRIGIIIKDEPVLVDDNIRRIGDALAIVAAETKEIAEEALKLIEVEYEELEPILSIEDALKEESRKVHGKTNVLQEKHLIKGDVDEAFKECDIIVENTYKTNYVAHMFIEPEAGVAKYENGIMSVWCSTQNPHFDRGEVARTLNMPQNKVRVIQAVTGGGFGGKLDISVQCHIALLSYYTGRPVKIVTNREDSMKVSSKRHPIEMKVKTGAKKDGTILAYEAKLTSDTGAYASYGPAVVARAMTHISGPYRIPNVRIDATFVYTNNPMAGAYRGFGVPQAAIAHEGQMDALAEKIGMSPIEIRLKNALRVGDCTPTNQKLNDSIGIVETIEKAVEKSKEVIFNEGEVK